MQMAYLRAGWGDKSQTDSGGFPSKAEQQHCVHDKCQPAGRQHGCQGRRSEGGIMFSLLKINFLSAEALNSLALLSGIIYDS